MENQIEQYQRSQVSGMSQRELILMLYSGAIRFLNEARDAINQERFDRSWTKLDRARKIVLHLYSTLNMDAGQIAKDLAALYSYIVEQICVANARHETEPINTCIEVLRTVREAWEQIPDTERPGAAPETSSGMTTMTQADADARHPAGLSLKA